MDAVRKLILEKIAERETNMAEVSRRIGKNHAYLQQFIYRNINQELPERTRIALAEALGVGEAELKPPSLKEHKNGSNTAAVGLPPRDNLVDLNATRVSQLTRDKDLIRPAADLFGAADLPVFGTAEGGKGALIVTDQAVDWVVRPEPLLRVRDGYGIIITGDSMSPAHESGSTALVNPHLPPRAGDTCVFRAHGDDGTVHMCIKKLVRITEDAWHVMQHNPQKSFKLKRSEWQECHVTVGNYSRR
ncbi:S24 family peptidase [Bradyrhizobium sp. CCH5-F6]|uniref:S24 family peptidase n=1 Tax=Bradyrhizobium sp. CCH5-F6 TaxID=1768753 RepID=UPI00076A6573|nr:S24 family peptidase [Bradyrhizobium sp. CCH5-F6]